MSVVKHPLACCALCQLTISNRDSIESINQMVETLKKQAVTPSKPGDDSQKGQRACFVIVTPDEVNLEMNLIQLDFKEIAQFDRRLGYAKIGKLKMYFLNW